MQVVIFPQTYYQGYNTGANISERMPFCTPDLSLRLANSRTWTDCTSPACTGQIHTNSTGKQRGSAHRDGGGDRSGLGSLHREHDGQPLAKKVATAEKVSQTRRHSTPVLGLGNSLNLSPRVESTEVSTATKPKQSTAYFGSIGKSPSKKSASPVNRTTGFLLDYALKPKTSPSKMKSKDT